MPESLTTIPSRLQKFRASWAFLSFAISAIFLLSCSDPQSGLKSSPSASTVNSQMLGGNGGGGTGDGGGGQGVDCTMATGSNHFDLMLRDIYEARVVNGIKLKTFEGSSSQSMAPGEMVSKDARIALHAALAKRFGPALRDLPFGKESSWDLQSSDTALFKINFIDERDFPLKLSHDVQYPMNLPNGCSFVQIAYWADSAGSSGNGVLYINLQKWDLLDQLNKIALLAHEYFYKQARVAGYQNSELIRSEIGGLFSVEGLGPLFESWPLSEDPRLHDFLPASNEGYKYCVGTSADDSSAQLKVYEYGGTDGNQHLVIPMLQSKLINLSYLQGKNFSFVSKFGAPHFDLSLMMAMNLMLLKSFQFTDEIFANEPWIGSEDRSFFDIQVAGFGLIDDPASHEDFMGSMVSAPSVLALDNQMILWSDFIQSADSEIHVELLNPMRDDEGSKWEMRPPEELIRIANEKIERKLTPDETEDGKYGIYRPDLQIPSILSRLNNEIDETISRGDGIHGFPKWKSEVLKIPDSSGSSAHDLKLLTDDLPSLIFRIKTKTYNPYEVMTLLGPAGFTGTDIYSNHPEPKAGRIRVRQGDSTLTFAMDCHDFQAAYSELTSGDLAIDHLEDSLVNPKLSIKIDEDIETSSQYFKSLGVLSASFIGLDSAPKIDWQRAPGDGDSFRNRNLLRSLMSSENEMILHSCRTLKNSLRISDFWFDSQVLDQGEKGLCTVMDFPLKQESFLLASSTQPVGRNGKRNMNIVVLNHLPYSLFSFGKQKALHDGPNF